MSEYIVELDSKHSIALKLAFAEEMRGGDFVREEIVRCRDCKWYVEANSLTGWNDICDLTDSNVQPNGFCAWAERKEVGE